MALENFEDLTLIGEGTYGKVFKAKLKDDLIRADKKEFRALKKLKLD